MTALVGQFAPNGGWFRARPVDLEEQPSWILVQMHAMWRRKFLGDTGRMVDTLLARDWSLLAHTGWPPALPDDNPQLGAYVNGVGRAHRDAVTGRHLVGLMPTDPPHSLQRWAYLWEFAGGALHVYAAAAGEWHHVATLPRDVWAGLTKQVVLDIEARRGWLGGAA